MERKTLKMIYMVTVVLMTVVFIYVISWFYYPDIATLKRKNPEYTAFMLYRQAQWKEMGKKVTIKKRWVSFNRISDYLVRAVIIAEDDKFWSHEGFDYEAMEKALKRDLREKKLKFGGSTITQQLAKNLYLSPSKNPLRKLREAAIAWRIERELSKKRILELYLNVAEWGEGIFGAEAASMHYFGKKSEELDPEEAARLAAILPSPLKYNPHTSQYVVKRAIAILKIMERRGLIETYGEEISDETDGSQPTNATSEKAIENE